MTKQLTGPRKDWGRWAEARHKRLTKPRRLKLPKKPTPPKDKG